MAVVLLPPLLAFSPPLPQSVRKMSVVNKSDSTASDEVDEVVETDEAKLVETDEAKLVETDEAKQFFN